MNALSDDRFYDLSEPEIRRLTTSEAYEYESNFRRERLLCVSYEGGDFPIYRPPLPEWLFDHNKIEVIRREIETEKDESLKCAGCGKYLGDNNSIIKDGPHAGARPTDLTTYCEKTKHQEAVIIVSHGEL